jgi:hypothetical protein
MAKKTTESVLGLRPLPRQSGFESTMSLVLAGNNQGFTKREKVIYINVHEQEVIIDLTGRKAIFGIEKMNEVKRAAASDELYTLQYMDELRVDTQLTHSQGAFDEFLSRLTTSSARHTLGAVDVGSTLIATEISRTFYPTDEDLEDSPKPEPPRTFMQRLLGG